MFIQFPPLEALHGIKEGGGLGFWCGIGFLLCYNVSKILFSLSKKPVVCSTR